MDTKLNNFLVGYYDSCTKIDSFKMVQLFEVYVSIKSYRFKTITENFLEKHKEGIKDGWVNFQKNEYQNEKASNFPVVTFSTNIKREKDKQVSSDAHTGIINLDIDSNSKEELDNFFNNIVPTIPYIEACGLSISGAYSGYRWVNARIEIPTCYEELSEEIKKIISETNWLDKLHKFYHKNITDIFKEKYNIIVGSSNDLKRCRSLCHDPSLFINHNVEEFKIIDLITSTEGYETENSGIIESLYGNIDAEKIMQKIIEKEGMLVEGDRSLKYVKYFGLCNSIGISKEKALLTASKYGGDYYKICEDIYGRYKSQFNSLNNLSDLNFLTDNYNSNKLAEIYHDKIRYCSQFNSWYIFNGKNWEKDNTQGIMRLAIAYVNDVNKKATESGNKQIIKNTKNLESFGKISSMVRMTQVKMPITPDRFDYHMYKINLLNGTYNLTTGILEKHNPNEYHTKICNVSYDETAKAPLWEAFLNRIFNNNQNLINFLQKATGYALCGSVEHQVIFILYGIGANGKSTFIKTIETLLGDYAQQMPASSLMTKKLDGAASNDIARLNGSRFVAASETDENRKFSESLIKQLTGGDTIVARFLFGEYFEFNPTHKIFLSTNHKPKITGTDRAIWRRILLIPFNITIPDHEKDLKLLEKLEKELPGIFNWAVEGYKLQVEHGLNPPAEVIAATEEYKEEMDLIKAFINQEVGHTDNGLLQSSALYKVYKKWTENIGEYPLSQAQFSRKMIDNGFVKERYSFGMAWKNIFLLNPNMLSDGSSNTPSNSDSNIDIKNTIIDTDKTNTNDDDKK